MSQMDMKRFDNVCRWISIVVSVVSIVFLLSLLMMRCVARVVVAPLLAMRSRSAVMLRMRSMMKAMEEDEEDEDGDTDTEDTGSGAPRIHQHHHYHHHAYSADDENEDDFSDGSDDGQEEEEEEEEEQERRRRILASRRSLQRQRRRNEGNNDLALFPPQMGIGSTAILVATCGNDGDNKVDENTHDNVKFDHVGPYGGGSASLAIESGKSALIVSTSAKAQNKWKSISWRILNVPKSYMALQKRCIFFLLQWDLVICITNLAVRSLQQQHGMSATKRNFIEILTSALEAGVLASGVWNVCIIVCIMFSSQQILKNFAKPATSSVLPYIPGTAGRSLQHQGQDTRSRARILLRMWIAFHLVPLTVFMFIVIFNSIVRARKVMKWQSLSFMVSAFAIVTAHTVLITIAIVMSIVCVALILRMFQMIKQVPTKRRTRRQGSAILRLSLYGVPFLVSTSFLILQRGLTIINELILVIQYGLPDAGKHYFDSPLYVPSQVFRGLYHIVLPTKPFIDAVMFIVISPWFIAMVKERFLFRYLSAAQQQRIMTRRQRAADQLGQPLMT